MIPLDPLCLPFTGPVHCLRYRGGGARCSPGCCRRHKSLGGSGGTPPLRKILDSQRWLLECSDCTSGLTKNDVPCHIVMKKRIVLEPSRLAGPLPCSKLSLRKGKSSVRMKWLLGHAVENTNVRTNRPSSMHMRSSERA